MSDTLGYTGTIEQVTIAASGTYAITADGAEGGQSTFAGQDGGLGAAVGGDIFLAQGAVLDIVVGGAGDSAIWGGGGGGASYVIETFNGVTSVDTILAIAGGGGGGGVSGVGGGGVAGPNGDDGAGASGGLADDNGINGAGEGGGNSGGGGGGFTGGGGAPNIGESGLSGAHSGTTFLGGDHTDPGGGGFGGGGGGGGYGGTGFHGGGGGGGGLGGGGGGTNSGGGGGGSYLASGFTHTFGFNGDSSEGHAGDGQVTIDLVCFCSGTMIRTTRGEIAVQDLAIGDLAVTASGEARPIRWIGSRRIAKPARAHWPVRVKAGAIGEGAPARDLWLSPGHAVCLNLIGEVFTPVGELVNGATIVCEAVSEVTYWHVELESHDVLLAEGLPCESYMDAGNRAWFGREYGRLAKVDPERIVESLSRYARPFVTDAATTEAIRRRLAARAEWLGWNRTGERDLHLLVDGRRLDPVIEAGVACFAFPAGARAARLCSRTFSPAWTGEGVDRRELGICMSSLRIGDGRSRGSEVALDALGGFHPEEAEGGHAARWTDGALELPAALWSACDGLAILTLAFDPGAGWAWSEPDAAAGPQLRAVA